MVMVLMLCSATINHKHPYHVGSVELNYTTKSSTVQVVGKFFTDDLEAALKKHHQRSFDLSKENNADNQAAVASYAKAAIRVKINGKQVALNALGYEVDRESTLIYLESPKTATPSKLECSIGMLYNVYEDQIHIIHYIVNGQRQSRKVSFPDMYSYAKF